jgi:general secretion pathway protein G
MDTNSLKKTLRARRLRRQRQQGMTLIEIMIVLVIIGMIAGAVGFAVLPQLAKAKIKATRADAKKVSGAAELWVAEHGGCPTVSDLIEDKLLNTHNRTVDAWEHDFNIECDGDGPVASSAGPDGQMGNEDDVQ